MVRKQKINTKIIANAVIVGAVVGAIGGIVATPAPEPVVDLSVELANMEAAYIAQIAKVAELEGIEHPEDLSEALKASETKVIELETRIAIISEISTNDGIDNESAEEIKALELALAEEKTKISMMNEYIDEMEGDLADVYDEADSEDEQVEIIAFDLENRKMAIDAVKDELFEELDNVVVDGISLDEDDMKRLKLDDDFEDINMTSIDYADLEVTYAITGTFEQDNDKFDFVIEVSMEENEFDDLDIINVTKR